MSYSGTAVLRDITASFEAGSLVSIVGPNGAGKSTLLGLLTGLRPGHLGTALLNGKPVERWDRRSFAKLVSFIPQSVRVDFPFLAEQVVMMGRTPHAEQMFETPDDLAAVRDAMRLTDTSHLAARDFRSLSGGERQRVILAASLAQQPQALLLDEPTTFLDLRHQIDIFETLRDRARAGLLVVAVTHDLNLAAMYSDRVLVLCCGELMADAEPRTALDAEMVARVFGVRATLLEKPSGGFRVLYGD